jgi:hypothetical protein
MASPSPSTDLVTAMQSAQKYLYQLGCPILILMGTVSCALNLIIFRQRTLRRNPCSIYFIAYNMANFLYIYSSLLSLTLNLGYNIDFSAHSLIICRLRLYITILLNCLSPFFLILAAIDRILVTSRNALTRQRSTRRLAYTCIILGTLFWALFHSHALIWTNVEQTGSTTFLCYFQAGVYLTFIGYYSLIKETLVFLLMLICGLWPIKNIRQIRRIAVAPNLSVSRTTGESNPHSTSSKDRQLILMLLMDIGVYTLFSFALAIFLMYQQITQNYIKSADQIQIEFIVRNLCLFSVGIPFCVGCYTNLLVSKTFRRKVKKVLLCR